MRCSLENVNKAMYCLTFRLQYGKISSFGSVSSYSPCSYSAHQYFTIVRGYRHHSELNLPNLVVIGFAGRRNTVVCFLTCKEIPGLNEKFENSWRGSLTTQANSLRVSLGTSLGGDALLIDSLPRFMIDMPRMTLRYGGKCW